MKMKIFAVLFAVVFMIALPAAAGTITYTLTKDGCTGKCLNVANPSAGTVTLQQDGTKVDVTLTLNAGFGLIDTGVHDSFTFTIKNNPTISISSLTSGFTWGTSGNDPPFGKFGVFVDCTSGKNQLCGNGGSNPYYGTLKFTVSLASAGTLSVNDFVGNANSPPMFFASDVFSTWTGKTGAVGAPGPGTYSVPEPDSMLLLGSGFLGLAGLLRRRNK
jgi:hypothetical protein